MVETQRHEVVHRRLGPGGDPVPIIHVPRGKHMVSWGGRGVQGFFVDFGDFISRILVDYVGIEGRDRGGVSWVRGGALEMGKRTGKK